MKKYIGKRTIVGPCQVVVGVGVVSGEHPGQETIHVLKHIVRHSPTGFQWGYGGSGPADLALSILTDLIGLKRAERLYQDFKWKFIAPVHSDLELREDEIRAWVEEAESTRSPRSES